MSAEDDRQKPKVGYRNPPQSGQFPKGVSGNPRGRPKKRRDTPALPDHRDPTVREVIRAEINREITVTDQHGRRTITTKQAVMRAMAVTALKGGILAQRNFIEAAAKEEARYQKEKRRRFRFWRTYKDEAAARIAIGGPRPVDYPDPDDIKLDWRTQEVRIDGPFDQEDRVAAATASAAQDLCYEMALYLDEFSHMIDDSGRIVRVGMYFGMYLLCRKHLWPRMRKSPEACDEVLISRAWWRDDELEYELRPRCHALGLPFMPRRKGCRPVMIPLTKLGVRKPIVVPPTPPRPRSPHRERRPRQTGGHSESGA